MSQVRRRSGFTRLFSGLGPPRAREPWDLELRLEVFYSPLPVVRQPSTEPENGALLNLRSMLRVDL